MMQIPEIRHYLGGNPLECCLRFHHEAHGDVNCPTLPPFINVFLMFESQQLQENFVVSTKKDKKKAQGSVGKRPRNDFFMFSVRDLWSD